MSVLTLGPRLGMFLAMASVMVAFVGGTFYGAKSEIAQGLVNEVSVLVADSTIANEIRAEEYENVRKVDEKLKDVKPVDCANRSMHELMGLPVQSSKDHEP